MNNEAMNNEAMNNEAIARRSHANLFWPIAGLVTAAAIIFLFADGLSYMVRLWSRAEYSYAYIVPLMSAVMIWQKRHEIEKIKPRGQWIGLLVVVLGLLLGVLGELSTIYALIHYGVIVIVFGIACTILGYNGCYVIIGPLLYLIFIVPIPDFLYQGLATRMQLISSNLGVAFMRPFGISVFLEGNIIDLGTYKLQVVEACSGLRYLFPLLSFSFLCAYLYVGPFWQRALIFVSAAPITIIINSVRIGIIGIIVDNVGIEAAEGFLHLFEGWLIFLAGVGFLTAGMWLLSRLSKPRLPLMQRLRLHLLIPTRGGAVPVAAASRGPFLSVAVVLAVTAVVSLAVPTRAEVVPPRTTFASFPMSVGHWVGREEVMEQIYVDALKLDDYVLADYRRPDDPVATNFYVAYYGSQRKGASAHSPRTCIPGGGWEIAELSRAALRLDDTGAVIPVNRAVIGKGASKQLVYYWFQQRGRHMTNEYMVKIMLLWDALKRSRTDGALVRVVTPVLPGEDDAQAERRLTDFVRDVYGTLEPYIPL